MNFARNSVFLRRLRRFGFSCVATVCFACHADPNLPMPPLIQKGLELYERSGVEVAFDAWQHGGLLEGNGAKARLFREVAAPLGNYKSSEVIAIKDLTRTSKIVYFSMDFKRGAVYARFLLYKTDTDWVTQNLVFSASPEAIMPWLALAGENAVQ